MKYSRSLFILIIPLKKANFQFLRNFTTNTSKFKIKYNSTCMIELVNLFDKIAYSKIILICASLKLKFKEKKFKFIEISIIHFKAALELNKKKIFLLLYILKSR